MTGSEIIQVVTMICATIAGILSYLNNRNGAVVESKVKELDVKVDGRLTQLLEEVKVSNLLQGQKEGTAAEQARIQAMKERG